MTPLRQVILKKERLIIPIPMKYEACGENENSLNLKVGKLYGLQGQSCDDFEMPINVFMCKGVVREYHGITLDVVIMKHVEGEEGQIFSLTRSDCNLLGIEYEPRLQVFPIDFNWIPIEHQDIREYTPNNLGTYKPSPKTNTIQQMHLFMRLVRPCSKTHLYTPNDSLIPIDLFLNSLSISFNDINLRQTYQIIVKPLLTRGVNSSFFDTDRGGVNFMVFFTSKSSVDGINPAILEGKSFDDLFTVSWQEPDINNRRNLVIHDNDYFSTKFKVYYDSMYNTLRRK